MKHAPKRPRKPIRHYETDPADIFIALGEVWREYGDAPLSLSTGEKAVVNVMASMTSADKAAGAFRFYLESGGRKFQGFLDLMAEVITLDRMGLLSD